jgi:sugar lactone lactonase YvrE
VSIKRIAGWSGMAASTAAVLAVAASSGGGPAAAATRAAALPSAAGTISTVAGGVGGPGEAITVGLGSTGHALSGPCGVTAVAGHLYVADNNTVRSVDPRTDQLTTPAGTGLPGSPHFGGPSAQANGLDTCSVAVDGADNLVLADPSHQRILVAAQATGPFYGQAMTAGHLYSVAGSGTRRGFSGDGGPATAARLSYPAGVAIDAAGNLVIADTSNSRIRVVAAHSGTFYGQAMTAGDIYTIAGDGTEGFAGDGGPATAAELGTPPAVALDGAGNVLIDDGAGLLSGNSGNNRIRVVAEHTGTFYGQAMTAGSIYTVAGGGTSGLGDGGPATSAELFGPADVTTDGAGNLVIADTLHVRVRVVAASTGTFYGQPMTAGDIYTVAGDGTPGDTGDGGPATSAELDSPDGVLAGAGGNLVIADQEAGRVRVVAASTGTFYGQAMTAGDIYRVAGAGVNPFLFSGDGGLATRAQAFFPEGLTVDAAGNLLITDTGNNRIRVAAAGSGTFYGRSMTGGNIYTIAGNGKSGFAGDGGPAAKAEVNFPQGVTLDAAGNLLITDTGNSRIRVVAEHTGTFYGQPMTTGNIYTIAGNGKIGFAGDGGPAIKAEFSTPVKAAVDGAGNVLISDSINNRIRAVAEHTGTFYGQAMTKGHIYTIAGDGAETESGDGGPATAAGVGLPEGVAVDGHGNVLISAFGLIRAVAATTGTFYGQAMTADDIYTIAGGGANGLGDGGPATSAELGEPEGISVDSSGNVLFADRFNELIMVVAERSGTFYGRAMTAGDIYHVAGNPGRGVNIGVAGFSGDGGPALNAELDQPGDVAPDGSGLVFADTANNRIRMVTG